MFSRRSRFDSRPNRFTRALEAARARGAPLVDLTAGNPTLAGVPYDEARVVSAFARPEALRYEPEPLGLASARETIARLWGERGLDVAPERVVVTASTSEAYAFSFKLFCDPGDEVLVPAPSYPLLEHVSQLESVRLVRYPLGYDGAWYIDVDAVRRAVTAHTRAIVVVTPNNPTGSYLKRGELEPLAELGLPIVSDEVFAEYPLINDAHRARSALEAAETLVVALDGLSKLAALPQVKLAWMTLGGPEARVKEALARLELVADAFLSPSTAAQIALPELLANRHGAADAIRARVRANDAALRAACRDSEATPLFVEGGWYAVVRFPATRSDEDWALALLERGVVVHPGYFFDFEGPPCVVVSLLTPEVELAEGGARLARTVAGGS